MSTVIENVSSLASASVIDAIRTRRSVRGFLDKRVPRRVVEELLELAAQAPSGSNIQPWRIYVCAGAVKAALTRELLDAHFAGGAGHKEEYRYYPEPWREPYLARRRKVGVDLYGLLGIAKGNQEAMSRQHARNYEFFGADVGLFVTLPRDLPVGSWLDAGMFIQTLLIAARGVGLDTCPQQSFAKFHRIVRTYLGIPAEEIVVCGIALGYADPVAPANRLQTDRQDVSEFATFRGL
jgi:nitroreductase